MGRGERIHSNYEVIALIMRTTFYIFFSHQSMKCNTSFTTFTLIFPCRKQIVQLSKQLKTVYEFQDLKETIIKMRREADLLLENLQEEIDLHSSALNASIIGKWENILQLSVSGQRLVKSIGIPSVSHPVLAAMAPEHFSTWKHTHWRYYLYMNISTF